MNYLKLVAFFIISIFLNNLKGQLLINEIMSTNGSFNIETDYYNFPDWIEIYNSGASSVNLGAYYLSDDINLLKKWKIPTSSIKSGNYKLIYCDKENTGEHTNFGLQSDGETIYLSNISGEIVDQITFPQQYPDVSYGRNPTNTDQWQYCEPPTPGNENQVTNNNKISPKPLFSIPAGSYSGSQSVAISGQNIKYTLNGSKPDKGSTNYSSALNISQTKVVKSRTFHDGYLPGKTNASTYFINEHKFTLPVVSLSFDPDFFWNNTIGIYVAGNNGVIGNCIETKVNWNQPWEREAYLEYFDENGIRQISQPIGVKVSGGCSRTFTDHKSISLYARGKYGDADFDYSFFKQKPEIRRYKSVFLRNSGNDFNRTVIWDAMMQALFNNSIDIDYQSFQPTIVYFNGEYRGILNLREKVNEDYFLTNYELSRDSLDFIEGQLRSTFENHAGIVQGSSEDYWEMIEFIQNNDLSIESNYQTVASQIDIDEYVNYLAIQIYIANTDWPGNNHKFWRNSNNGKWRWVIYDTDFGFNAQAFNHQTFDHVTETNGPDWPNPPWSTLLIRKMLENQGFRDQLAKTILTFRNTVFDPEWCDYVVDSISSIVEYEMTYHLQKWGGDKNSWNWNLNNFKTYASSRYEFIPDYIASYFNLSGNQVTININNQAPLEGAVEVNQSKIMKYPFDMSTYQDLGISLEAKANPGYKFSHWKNTASTEILPLITTGSNWKYFDQGGDYPTNWNTSSFNDSTWLSGDAQLGYGDGDETTIISYGSDVNNKIPTYLFRKKIDIPNIEIIKNIEMGVLADDGVIVYINGEEVFRNNLDGTVTFDTYTTAFVADEKALLFTTLDTSFFNSGSNTIACEVHQYSGTSSDVSFDFSISYEKAVGIEDGVFSNNAYIYSDTSISISVEPVFEPIEETTEVYLNEIASTTTLFKDDKGEKTGFVELFNASGSELTLNGYFISDKKDIPTRYKIPEGTTIEANGFITFFADREAPQGELHMPFRASENGETFYLWQKVGNKLILKDSVEFELLVEGYSYGRYTDGTGEWQHMKNITPNKANDPAKPVIGIENIYIGNKIQLYPNPSNGKVYYHIEKTGNKTQKVSVEIYNLGGKTVYQRQLLNSNKGSVDLSSLDNGIYFVRMYSGYQILKTKKLVISK